MGYLLLLLLFIYLFIIIIIEIDYNTSLSRVESLSEAIIITRVPNLASL